MIRHILTLLIVLLIIANTAIAEAPSPEDITEEFKALSADELENKAAENTRRAIASYCNSAAVVVLATTLEIQYRALSRTTEDSNKDPFDIMADIQFDPVQSLKNAQSLVNHLHEHCQ